MLSILAGGLLGAGIVMLANFLMYFIPYRIRRHRTKEEHKRLKEYPLTYKQFSTVISYSFPNKLWHGIIEGIDDLVDFEAKSLRGCKREFKKAVNDYLKFKEMIK